MDDCWREDIPREDAARVLRKADGCGHCPELSECRAEGACVKELKIATEAEDG